jgi:hypothetical protein
MSGRSWGSRCRCRWRLQPTMTEDVATSTSLQCDSVVEVHKSANKHGVTNDDIYQAATTSSATALMRVAQLASCGSASTPAAASGDRRAAGRRRSLHKRRFHTPWWPIPFGFSALSLSGNCRRRADWGRARPEQWHSSDGGETCHGGCIYSQLASRGMRWTECEEQAYWA